ncbi:hypothetical protein [Planctomycetes bacterium K23_9]|uniref:Anaphase-promoting complex, cyclosome, subunit 3 n=1 Tax=Stieleria marina TaxID=1930275 RepID=A0A517NXM1_9BACT|nr:hypothetical protein K239x_38790 [Planctomycetes bacterium K23_9]
MIVKTLSCQCSAATLSFIATFSLVVTSDFAGAQEYLDGIDLVPVQQRAESGLPLGIEANLQSLLETTERVRERLATPQSSAGTDGESINPPLIPSADPAVTATEKPPSATESVGDLRKRIELLRRLRRNSGSAERSQRDQSFNRGAARQQAATLIPPLLSGSQLPGSRPLVDRSAVEPTLSAIESSLQPAPQTPPPAEEEPQVVSATQIFASPVDHLALGENLYQTKNYSAAFKALKAVDADKLSPADRTWLELLTALCDRRLGNSEAAEAQLREISNAKIADRSVPIARWWLKQSEMVKTAKPTLNEITNDLDTLIKRSETHVR